MLHLQKAQVNTQTARLHVEHQHIVKHRKPI